MPAHRGEHHVRWLDRMSSHVHRRAWLRRGVEGLDQASFIGRPIFSTRAGARIRIGARFTAVSSAKRQVIGVSHPMILRAVHERATIEIGDDCGFSGTTIVAQTRITIGDGCLAGADTMIVDTDFHPVHARDRRYAPMPAPQDSDAVSIGRNVFLGAGAVILKGVTIGDNSVIGARSVVHADVAADTIAAGNPARPIGRVVIERTERA